jgi:hypothetical protein
MYLESLHSNFQPSRHFKMLKNSDSEQRGYGLSLSIYEIAPSVIWGFELSEDLCLGT